MKNILTIRTLKGRKKQVEFNRAVHTVLLGYLCDRFTQKPIGKILKAETK